MTLLRLEPGVCQSGAPDNSFVRRRTDLRGIRRRSRTRRLWEQGRGRNCRLCQTAQRLL